MELDCNFDFQSDAQGRDPDAHSPMLRRFHQRLWSKPMPDGTSLALRIDDSARSLVTEIEGRELTLKSDSVIQTFSYWKRLQQILEAVDAEEIQKFDDISYTIGGMLVWPAGPPSINQDRGTSRAIADRIDLTLECVRRHYAGEEHPLSRALDGNAWFFEHFQDFTGYAEFFLLQDLLEEERAQVRFFLPFDGFDSSGMPSTPADYTTFMRRSVEFVEARTLRICAWLGAHTVPEGS